MIRTLTSFLLFAVTGIAIAQPRTPPEKWAPDPPKGADIHLLDAPSNFFVYLDITAPESFKQALSSALLLELRKRSDVQLVSTTQLANHRWELVCIETTASGMACSSVMLQRLNLDHAEFYFPDLKNYGFWWVTRTLEDEGGSIQYHGLVIGPRADISDFATRAVSYMEASAFDPTRKQRADEKAKLKSPRH